MPTTTKKLDFKKEFPEFYNPSPKAPIIIEIPRMKFFMIDGKGNPNTSSEYAAAIEALYAIAYALKMKVVKKQSPAKDYVMPPLEGLWYMDDMSKWSADNKDDWKWTMMLRIPDYVTSKQIEEAKKITEARKNPKCLGDIYIEEYIEGTSVQIMYFGSYNDEADTIKKIHQFAEKLGYQRDGKHHEIYLGDPRKIAPEKLKTIIRQPISKKKEK